MNKSSRKPVLLTYWLLRLEALCTQIVSVPFDKRRVPGSFLYHNVIEQSNNTPITKANSWPTSRTRFIKTAGIIWPQVSTNKWRATRTKKYQNDVTSEIEFDENLLTRYLLSVKITSPKESHISHGKQKWTFDAMTREKKGDSNGGFLCRRLTCDATKKRHENYDHFVIANLTRSSTGPTNRDKPLRFRLCNDDFVALKPRFRSRFHAPTKRDNHRAL